ncbi:MAG TPA: hypothetical protein VHX17_12090 [Candidatus Cybelea sp.]|nr:hypothetical protein [Candidatus Cybelea sp.]
MQLVVPDRQAEVARSLSNFFEGKAQLGFVHRKFRVAVGEPAADR